MVVHIKDRYTRNVNLYLIGDLHIGTNTFAKKEYNQVIDRIKKDPLAKVIFMGDNLDLVEEDDTRRFNKFTQDKKINTAEKQYQYFIKSVRPIKNKIIGILSGNHEMAYAKYHQEMFTDDERDHSERAANELKVHYLNDMATLMLTVKGKKYSVVVAHGMGMGTTLGAHVGKLLNIVSCYDVVPDIMAMGHVHNLQTVVNSKMNFEFKTKVKFIGLTGTFYKTYMENNMNYASSNLYKPSTIGCLMFALTKDSITDHKIIMD